MHIKKIVLTLILFTNSLLADSTADTSLAHTSFAPIPVGHFNHLLESIVAQEEFVLAEVSDRPVLTGTLWSGFERNLVNISADINSVTMRFIDSRAAIGQSSKDRAASFDLQIIFEDGNFITERMSLFNPQTEIRSGGAEASRVVVKHTRAAAQEEMNGIRLAISPEEQTRIYYNGLDETGVAIFIPMIPRTGFAGRALLVCPREFDIWRAKRGFRKLENSDYKLVSAVFSAQGKVEAKVNTGLGSGYAAASIQTSYNILPSQQSLDESVARFPYAAVDYRAVNQPLAPATFYDNQITAGISVSSVHHNSFQQRTVSRANVVIGISKVNTKSPLTFKYADNAYAIQPGECIAVIKEIELTQENSKVPLPEAAQVLPQVEPSPESGRVGEHLFDLTEEDDKPSSPLEDLLEQAAPN